MAWFRCVAGGESNITPYEFAIPFVVMCRNCSASNEFTFQLKDSNGDVVDTVNCTGANTTNSLSFQKLSFKKAGTFTYTISQVAGTDTDVEYDAKYYTIVFTLTLDSSNNSVVCSNLAITDSYGDTEIDTIFFSNHKSTVTPDL